ncbi:hypothetical protein QZH41_001168 [Actinostola sp. cb2023]|nr:hypothetical protein QZH41_001168 [Actinostola sp. cb2023]
MMFVFNSVDEEVIPQQMEQWYRQRMSKQQLDRKPARSLDLTRLVQYDQNQGLFLTVEQAFGLPNPTFVNVLAYVSLGPAARSTGKTAAGYGGEENTLIDRRDFSSLQKSPKWINDPKMFHPHLDPMSSLVLQLYALDAVYEPKADRQGPGSVIERKGKRIAVVPQGWTVVKLFDKVQGKCLYSEQSFMEFLSSHPGDVALREALRQDIHQLLGTSSVQVRICDGHYSKDDCIPLAARQDLLNIGNEAKIKKTMQGTSGKRIADVVLQCLTRQERKLGVDGQPYNQEKHYYEEAMNRVFTSLMDNVLLDLGLGPSSG